MKITRTTNLTTCLFDNWIHVCSAESLLQVIGFCDFALGNISEDIADLKYIVYIGFNAISPFLDFIFVASDLVLMG